MYALPNRHLNIYLYVPGPPGQRPLCSPPAARRPPPAARRPHTATATDKHAPSPSFSPARFGAFAHPCVRAWHSSHPPCLGHYLL